MSQVRVLLIDDDDVEREMIQRALNGGLNDCEIRSATSANGALKFIDNAHFDIILMDFHMPGLNGIEAIEKFRTYDHLKQAPIVIISNNSNENLALECINAGAQDFLLKSEVTSDQLSRAINQSKCRYEIEQELYDNYQQVKQLAEIDRLTGLHNRYFFDESLSHMLNEQKRSKDHLVAVMLLDLDKFKQINDNYGHEAGDKLLISVAVRIRSVLRGCELFSRLGGDEFALACTHLKSIRKIKNIAKRILKTFEEPFEIEGCQLYCGGSIGISVSPANGTSQLELMRLADIAMYRAKKQDKDKICVFEDNMELAFLKNYHIETELRADINSENNALTINYLPIIDQSSDTVTGLEALIRWTKDGRVRMPNEFITIAEESGLIRPLGKWILSTVLSKLSRAIIAKQSDFCLAVNVSPLQLSDPTFLNYVDKCLIDNGFSSKNLTLEMTEKAFSQNDPITVDTLKGLSKIGVKIALDDFGAELAPLTHLTTWSIDQVKIDRCMIQCITQQNSRQRAALEGVLGLLNKLDIEAIAVGIETNEQSKACKEIGMKKVQGFLHFKPLCEKDALSVIQNKLPNSNFSISGKITQS